MEELTAKRDELEAETKRMKEELVSKRRRLRELNRRKRDIIEAIKRKNTEANRAREKRDKLNAEIKKLKAKREEANAEVKRLLEEYRRVKEKAPKGDFKKLQREKNRLEWKLQTSVLEIKKEDELVKRIAEIEKELAGYAELINITRELEKKRKTSKKVHEKIIKLSDESQKYHEAFIAAVEKIKELEGRLDEVNREKLAITQELDRLNAELDEKIPQLKELEKEILELETGIEMLHREKSEKELREEAKAIYERFKRGEKLDLEDIYLLRRFNLV